MTSHLQGFPSSAPLHLTKQRCLSTRTLAKRPSKVSDEDLDQFKQLLKLSKIGPETYENQVANTKDYRGFGVNRKWLLETKKQWETQYD